MKMKYFSMFSGIGGFELGIQRAMDNQYVAKEQQDRERWDRNSNEQPVLLRTTENTPLCIGYSEIDKYAISTYESHFGGHKNYGNATEIKPEELPDFNMLCGGFPCQSFSIAGKRMGFKDTRGTLFFDIARIAKVKRPQILFLENVKGLLNHDNGRTFATILATLDELGYNAEWQVLNSKHFGVPQNRERVFIIGHLRESSSRQIFPLRETKKEFIQEQRNATKISGCLTARYWKMGKTDTYIKYAHKDKCQSNRVYDEKGIAPTIPSRGEKTGQNAPIILRDGRDNRSCLRSGRTTEVGYAGQSIRHLTPTECERLQSFPDGWTIGSDTQRYKQCGNAVTVNVIQAIMEKILA